MKSIAFIICMIIGIHGFCQNKVVVDYCIITDALTNQVVDTIKDGKKFDLACLPQQINIKLVCNKVHRGCIETQLNNYCYLIQKPYIISGWITESGQFNMSFTPYSTTRRVGIVGKNKNITFIIVKQ